MDVVATDSAGDVARDMNRVLAGAVNAALTERAGAIRAAMARE